MHGKTTLKKMAYFISLVVDNFLLIHNIGAGLKLFNYFSLLSIRHGPKLSLSIHHLLLVFQAERAPSLFLTFVQLHMTPSFEDGGTVCYYMAKVRLHDVNAFGLSVSHIQISNIKMFRVVEFSKFDCKAVFPPQTKT
jgi:hypothetical protein